MDNLHRSVLVHPDFGLLMTGPRRSILDLRGCRRREEDEGSDLAEPLLGAAKRLPWCMTSKVDWHPCALGLSRGLLMVRRKYYLIE